MEAVRVFAPSTVANVGCGYDTMGFAIDVLGEEIELSKRTDSQLVIKEIVGASLSTDPLTNVATVAIEAMRKSLGSTQGFDLVIKKLFKPGSGLGSSASSAAGAVYAANELLGRPFKKEQLLAFALEGEAFASKCYHADNVAPSLLGNMQVVRSYSPLEWFSVAVPQELKVLIMFPDVPIKTSEAKQLVPKEINVNTARNQWGNVAALVHALHTRDFQLLQKSIEDFIAEPVRKASIPYYDEAKVMACESGAVGYNISGSGPSMFAFFTNEAAQEVAANSVRSLYESKGIPVSVFKAQVDTKGCRVI